jgi:hypothetical protein
MTAASQVNIALVITGDRHHGEAGHDGTGRVGAVGARGNQAHIAVGLTAAAVPRPDHQQAGVLTLGAGIGLKRHPGETGQGGQPVLEIVDQLPVTGGLVGRSERMQTSEGRPAHRLQLGSRIELHRAAAQRDHPVISRSFTG